MKSNLRIFGITLFVAIIIGIAWGLVSQPAFLRPTAGKPTTTTPTPIATTVVSTSTASTTVPRLEPTSGIYFGVNLDWSSDSPAAYDQRLGKRAAVFVQFCNFPLGGPDEASLDSTVGEVAAAGGMLMVTLEPNNGLDKVTPEAADALATRLAGYNARGVAVFVRFAHEMNGSWYVWSQQPSAYIKAFRIVADAVHKSAPKSAMIWAPNYGGGYPFSGGQYEAKAGSTDFNLLDTNHDGKLTMEDDPYAPYYPGDEAVDWTGMSLYHWGNTYPWGENEMPEVGKFAAQLTGNYKGLNGDDTAVPDFYGVYYTGHGKPVAITETAALYNPAKPGPDELSLKRAWWRQVYDPATLKAYPGIKMINWFEQAKPESEVGGALIDWRALGTTAIAAQFRSDLPMKMLTFAP